METIMEIKNITASSYACRNNIKVKKAINALSFWS